MNQVFLIAGHEFRTTVKRLGYIFGAFILPLVMGGISVGGALIARQAELREREAFQRNTGVVDASGILHGDEPEGVALFLDMEGAQEAVRAERIRIFVVLPADYVETGIVHLHVAVGSNLIAMLESATMPAQIRQWILRCLTEGVATESVRERILNPVAQTRQVLLDPETGRASAEDMMAKGMRIGVAVIFFMLMFLAMMISGGYLMQGLADEKENRVMEIVLCAVTPERLMAGKLIGLGGAGLLSIVVWIVVAAAVALVLQLAVTFDFTFIALCILLFVFGYAMYGSLLLGTGSLGTNLREVSQWSAVWTIFSILPVMFMQVIMSDPHGVLARVLTYIPLTAATSAVLRHAIDPLPAWELALVFAILMGSTMLAIKAAAKVYRVGLLLYGKRITPAQIWRWLRA